MCGHMGPKDMIRCAFEKKILSQACAVNVVEFVERFGLAKHVVAYESDVPT